MPDNTDPPTSLTSQYKASSEHWRRQWATLETERDALRDALRELHVLTTIIPEELNTTILRLLGEPARPSSVTPLDKQTIHMAQTWLNLVYPTYGDGYWSAEFINEIAQGQHPEHANRECVLKALAYIKKYPNV